MGRPRVGKTAGPYGRQHPKSWHRAAKRCAGAIVVAAFVSAVMASSAPAAEVRPFLSELTGAATPAEEFGEACGAFVDENGDLYVANYGTSSIDIYGPSFQYLTSIEDENGPCSGAVDSEGNVYVMDFNSRTVVAYELESTFPPTASATYSDPTTIDASGTNNSVAVDPADDTVYTTRKEPVGEVAHFESLAEGSELIDGEIGAGELNTPWGLDVYGATGDVYVTSHALEHDEVKIFDSAGLLVESIDGSTSPDGPFPGGEAASLTFFNGYLAVDQGTGNFVVPQIEAHGVIDEFEPDGSFVTQFGIAQNLENAEPSDLAIDNSGGANDGDVYVTSGAGTSTVYRYGPLGEEITEAPLSVNKAGAGSGRVSSTPAGIDCGSTCSAGFPIGEEVTLTADEEEGSTFEGWTGCESDVENECTVTVSADTTVTATFDLKEEAAQTTQLSVSKSGTGQGLVTSSPAGIDCGSICAASFPLGAKVMLTAAPAPNSRFAGWSGACDGSGPCEVTMSAAQGLSANFEAIEPSKTCPADLALCPPSTAILASKKAPVKGGKASVSFTCPGPGACSGSLKLTGKITTGKGKKKKSKMKTVGSASFALAGGASATIQVKLTGAAKSALRAGPLNARVSGSGIQTGQVKLKASGGK